MQHAHFELCVDNVVDIVLRGSKIKEAALPVLRSVRREDYRISMKKQKKMERLLQHKNGKLYIALLNSYKARLSTVKSE